MNVFLKICETSPGTRMFILCVLLATFDIKECFAKNKNNVNDAASVWAYTCDDNSQCVRSISHPPFVGEKMSLTECKLTCGPCSRLWPKPTGSCENSGKVLSFDPYEVTIGMENANDGTLDYLNQTLNHYLDFLKESNGIDTFGSHKVQIQVELENPGDGKPRMRRNTNESYKIEVEVKSDGTEPYIDIDISAPTYFGARNALDSLSQSWGIDDLNKKFILLDSLKISDGPHFPHRGVLVDTSRSFISKDTILTILDGMSYSKLNVFHWHITDSQSFPIALEKYPDTTANMVKIGSYNKNSRYSVQDVKDIVEHANLRGIRVIPEFDSPAHVGFGWRQQGWEEYTVCVDHQPWEDYCVEPGCGQLNPFHDSMYEVLNQLFQEYLEIFDYDSFHTGGDEVNHACWKESTVVKDYMKQQGFDFDLNTQEGFHDTWAYYHERQLNILKSLENTKKQQKSSTDDDTIEYIIWTSGLTAEPYIHHLSAKNYTIQIWTDSNDLNDHTIPDIVNNGFDMIFSNTDAMYLDCGYGTWIGTEGNNWCSPYKGWQQQYDNDPYRILTKRGIEITDGIKKQLRGGEAAMWTEQVDGATIEGKLFPRISALGERLWSNPNENWKDDYMEVEVRMVTHRHLLVDRGINADALQPEYCFLSEGSCKNNRGNEPTNKGTELKISNLHKYCIILLLFLNAIKIKI